MIPTDLKNHSRFSWYYKTKIRNWLWSITRVNPIAWCGNPEGLGTALQFLQDDSRLSLIVQNSGSKARVFLTNGLERAMKLKSDRFWKSGLWKKRKFWKPQKGVVYLSSLDNFIYRQVPQKRWDTNKRKINGFGIYRNVPESSTKCY